MEGKRSLVDLLLGRHRGTQVSAIPGDLATILQTSYYNGQGNERVDPGAFISYATQGYSANAIVFAIIGARMHLFSEAQPAILDEETGRILPPDDRLRILREPWPNGSSGELLSRMEQDASLAGNAFILRQDDRLIRLRPDWVEMVVLPGMDGHPEVQGYLYSPDGIPNEDSTFYQVKDVAHYSPVPDPLSAYRGMSWLTPVVREVNADIAMTTHKTAFFENAATPNLLIRYESKLSPETLANLSARFAARHEGAANAWKTAVLDEGADISVIGHSMEQMTFTAIQSAGENRIAAAAGTPGIVVGLKEGLTAATYSNFEQAMRRFADGTLRPLWHTAAASLAKFVDLAEGEQLVLDASAVDALREGESQRAETFRIKAVTAGELIRSGYDPDTVATAVSLGDLSVLKHTGGVPTALYQDGQDPSQSAPAKQSPQAQGSKGDGMSG